MIKKAFRGTIIIAVCAAVVSFVVPKQSVLTIQFSNYVGNEILKIDSVSYKNELNQSFTVSELKYYVSNIILHNLRGKDFVFSKVFLIDQRDKASQKINFSEVPSGDYSSITFTLGVDSIHNCSGAESGALDPINGMFWTWNTGYIFLKMTGKSPESHSPGDILEFHIGGYKQPYNCIRKITLDFKNGLKIENSDSTSIKIKADLSEVFKTPTTIDFSKTSSVTDFHGATVIANNYQDMFRLMK